MKKIILTNLIFLFSNLLFSQTGPKVVVFNGADDEEKEEKIHYINMIKLSPLEYFSGDLPIYYERIINEHVSAEVGLGITTANTLSNALNYVSSDYRNYLIGTSFGLGVKYYPFRAAEEFYFSPDFKYRYYHNTYNPSGISTGTIYKENEAVTSFRIKFGYVYFFDDRIFVDYYGGLGVAQHKSSSYGSPIYDNVSQTYLNNLITKSDARFQFTLGVKFGFAF